MNPEALLTPISESSPCGADLSYSQAFDAIQQCRRADDPSLDQGDWVTEIKSADWPGVLAQCTTVFASTKDLRVAAWMTEASAQVDGYSGLADGLELCWMLCERFWDTMHPQPDEDADVEQRSGNLRWLLCQVEDLASALPVLSHGTRNFSLRDIEMANSSAWGTERKDYESPLGTAFTLEDVAAARRETSSEALEARLAAAVRAQKLVADLQDLVDARLGADGPAFGAARAALDKAIDAIDKMLPRSHAPSLALLPASSADSTRPSAGTGARSNTPTSRGEALAQLRAVAEFFRRTEPHSPVAYLAERAAQWGGMPLHQWLRVVVKDERTLSQMEELLGMETLTPRTE